MGDLENAGRKRWRIAQGVSLVVMVMLAVWVVATAIRIELANVEANYFLPRQDLEAGSKWRIIRDRPDLNHLRHLVETVGLYQYPLSVLVIILAAYHFAVPRSQRWRLMATLCGLIGVGAFGLANYRAYFPSLGW